MTDEQFEKFEFMMKALIKAVEKNSPYQPHCTECCQG